MTSNAVSQVQVVDSDREALEAMIRSLVDDRLIACGQVLGPIRSTFCWEGTLQHEEEWLALLKTASSAVSDLVARIAHAHSYDVPEILVTDVTGGYGPYLDWVVATARPAHSQSSGEGD
jgi:periplasmic divalent cation tolerance protein